MGNGQEHIKVVLTLGGCRYEFDGRRALSDMECLMGESDSSQPFTPFRTALVREGILKRFELSEDGSGPGDTIWYVILDEDAFQGLYEGLKGAFSDQGEPALEELPECPDVASARDMYERLKDVFGEPEGSRALPDIQAGGVSVPYGEKVRRMPYVRLSGNDVLICDLMPRLDQLRESGLLTAYPLDGAMEALAGKGLLSAQRYPPGTGTEFTQYRPVDRWRFRAFCHALQEASERSMSGT